MTKQEKIQEAYGENWELVKYKVNKDGWIKDREFIFSDFINGIDWQTTDHDDEYYDTSRPKSLKGIEDNNGWIKINNETDLPKEGAEYWVVTKRGTITKASYLSDRKVFFVFGDIQVTHYQKLIYPQKPIY